MLSAVLVATGLFLTIYGGLRGYAAARTVVLPLGRVGEPTRTLVDSTRPLLARTRVRGVARSLVLAFAWLAIAMYGLYLATVGLGPPA